MACRTVIVACPSSDIEAFISFVKEVILRRYPAAAVVTSSDPEALAVVGKVAAIANVSERHINYSWDSIHDTVRLALPPTDLALTRQGSVITGIESPSDYLNRLQLESGTFRPNNALVLVSPAVLGALQSVHGVSQSGQFLVLTKEMFFSRLVVERTADSDFQAFLRDRAADNTMRDLRTELLRSIEHLFQRFQEQVQTEVSGKLVAELSEQVAAAVTQSCAQLENWVSRELQRTKKAAVDACNEMTQKATESHQRWQARLQSIRRQQEELIRTLSVPGPSALEGSAKQQKVLAAYEHINRALTEEIAELQGRKSAAPKQKAVIITKLTLDGTNVALKCTNRKLYTIEKAELVQNGTVLKANVSLVPGDNMEKFPSSSFRGDAFPLFFRVSTTAISEEATFNLPMSASQRK